MANANIYDDLDEAVKLLIDGDAATCISTQPTSTDIRELLEAANDLRYVARPEFKAQLRADLLDEAFVGDVANHFSTGKNGKGNSARNLPKHDGTASIMPSLFGSEGMYPVRRTNFAASALLHAAVMGLFVASSLWMVQHKDEVKPYSDAGVVKITAYISPVAPKENHGGGAGGAREKIHASQGQAPKFAAEQITPPTVVVRNPQPVLTTEPTIIGPPKMNLPQLSQLGDPLSRVVPASNGTGSGGGMGSNTGTGVGGGNGPGLGIGSGGGVGGEIYGLGSGVSTPHAIYAPDPEYSEEARKAHYQGTVILWAVTGLMGCRKISACSERSGWGSIEKRSRPCAGGALSRR
jgi:hypothetical protein